MLDFLRQNGAFYGSVVAHSRFAWKGCIACCSSLGSILEVAVSDLQIFFHGELRAMIDDEQKLLHGQDGSTCFMSPKGPVGIRLIHALAAVVEAQESEIESLAKEVQTIREWKKGIGTA